MNPSAVKGTFDSGKKLIVIGIRYNSASPLICYYDINPQGLDKYTEEFKSIEKRKNLFVQVCHTLIHEAIAHAQNRLLNIAKTTYEEHEAYNGQSSTGSPSVMDIKTMKEYKGTQANKNIIELEKHINEIYNSGVIFNQK